MEHMTEVTGMAICHCPYCDKEFESEVTIEVEAEDIVNDVLHDVRNDLD